MIRSRSTSHRVAKASMLQRRWLISPAGRTRPSHALSIQHEYDSPPRSVRLTKEDIRLSTSPRHSDHTEPPKFRSICQSDRAVRIMSPEQLAQLYVVGYDEGIDAGERP